MQMEKFNDDFKEVKNLLGNQMSMFVFGKPLTIVGVLKGEDLYLALDLLFA